VALPNKGITKEWRGTNACHASNPEDVLAWICHIAEILVDAKAG
jgi:hypothetical protein|tara:strand:+ start:7646 stop:7777 length:132 start_codon:yes stop_codon:yes gene_type:complete